MRGRGSVSKVHRERPVSEEELEILTENVRRDDAINMCIGSMDLCDRVQYLASQTSDPRLQEAFRHISYGRRLLFLYGNDAEATPDFESWEK